MYAPQGTQISSSRTCPNYLMLIQGAFPSTPPINNCGGENQTSQTRYWSRVRVNKRNRSYGPKNNHCQLAPFSKYMYKTDHYCVCVHFNPSILDIMHMYKNLWMMSFSPVWLPLSESMCKMHGILAESFVSPSAAKQQF